MDSNFTQGEMIVNKDYTLTRDFEYQIYEGLILIYTFTVWINNRLRVS